MALMMNMDPALGFSPTGFRVLPRQDSKCDAGVMGPGGQCVAKSTCSFFSSSFQSDITIADKDQAMEHYTPRTVVRGTR